MSRLTLATGPLLLSVLLLSGCMTLAKEGLRGDLESAQPIPEAETSAAADSALSVFLPQAPEYYPNPSVATSEVREAIAAWARTGSRIVETHNEADATTMVQFIKEWGGDTLGQAFAGGLVQVGLGDSACNDKWTPFDERSIRAIAMHELGHELGFAHSDDPNDIMYPSQEPIHLVPCEFDEGTLTPPANGGWHGIGFRLSATRTIEVETKENAMRSTDVGIVRGEDYDDIGERQVSGWGWQYGVSQTKNSVTLAGGEYNLVVWCRSQSDCSVNYWLRLVENS